MAANHKPMFVFLNGKFVQVRSAAVSILDHGFLYGDGVYETLRTYGGQVWQLEEHLRRLEKSAGFISLRLPWNRARIGSWVRKLVKMNGFGESRIRITVTRGVNDFVFAGSRKPTILIQAVELKPQPAAVYARGVRVITVKMARVLPEAKSISLLPFVLARQKMEQEKAYEALFVDGKGCVLEGTITNVFMVEKGMLVTPRKGILFGTTREVILKLARRLGISVREQDVTLRRLFAADEVFISNAPRGIVPVRQVDGRKIGRESRGKNRGKSGCGPVTGRIMKAFDAYVRDFSLPPRKRRPPKI